MIHPYPIHRKRQTIPPTQALGLPVAAEGGVADAREIRLRLMLVRILLPQS